MMDNSALYGSKVKSAADAVEPPALLDALAKRAEAGRVGDLHVYYCESMKTAGQTILRYELNDRIQPYCMFVTGVESALIKRGMEDGGRKVVSFIPNNFHQAVRLLTEEVHIDTFVTTVSPMDARGYFSFGTGSDYSTKVARSAKRLIVEVNRNMPRVMGEGAALHVSEVHAVVENDVPLLELPVGEPNADDLTLAKTIAAIRGVVFGPSSRATILDTLPSRPWIVTEFGAANMKGMSSTERAHALIALANPEFRDELTAAAKPMYLI